MADQEIHAPEPELDHTLYTKARVNQSYEYVQARLEASRKPPPRTTIAFLYHQKNCLDLLHPDSVPGTAGRRQRAVQVFEGEMNMQPGWLTKVLPPNVHSLMEELVALRWMKLLACVGDYMNIECGELYTRAAVLATEGHDHISGKHQWSAISERLEEEAKLYHKDPTREDGIDTFCAVQAACRSASLDLDKTILCIRIYGERNTLFHNEIAEEIKIFNFTRVAHLVYDAINDLHSLVPIDRMADGIALRKYFHDLRDNWFKVYDPTNPNTWAPKPLLMETRDRYRAGTTLAVPSTPQKSPKKNTPAPGTPKENAEKKHLEAEILSSGSYKLPIAEYTPRRLAIERELMENAGFARARKGLKASAWGPVIFKNTEIRGQDEDMKKAHKVYKDVKKAIESLPVAPSPGRSSVFAAGSEPPPATSSISPALAL